MATTEERLAALEKQMAAWIDQQPTTYYTHQYSGEEIDAAVGRAVTGGALDTSVTNVSNQLGTFVRPNLLDNWYFGNLVNQRGQTSYTDPGYGIDRWFMYSGTLKIQNGIIELSGSSSGGTFEQKIENPKRFAGKTVTLSVLGKRSKASWYITVRQDGVYRNINLSITKSFACTSVTFVADSTLSNELAIVFACWDESDVAEIKAAKLELGPTQTLAHREGDKWVLNEVPDYGEQLRRCQRYAIDLAASEDRKYGIVGVGVAVSQNEVQFMVPLPTTMRARPVAKFSGTWKFVHGTDTNYGLPVTTISVDRLSTNTVVLNTFTNENLITGDTYMLWRSDNSNNSLFLSSDL